MDDRERQQSQDDLQALDERLKRLKSDGVVRDPLRGPVKQGQGAEAARYAVEFFGATVFGFGIGWYLDGVLGTRPWLMIVIGILGFTAGVLNVYRVAEASSRQREKAARHNDQGT